MRKAIENTTQMPIYVNGCMIPPGETRHFDDDMIPPEHRDEVPVPEPEPEADRVADIAAMKADIIIPVLRDFDDAELARLQAMETDGKARKTVLEAIAAEGLKRAQVETETPVDSLVDTPDEVQPEAPAE